MSRLPVKLKVGGITPFTATDYPGKLAAVVFVQGCPWRCGYCHNPHLQVRTPHSPIAWADVTGLLERRAGLIDAVVFSGGEPTMDPGLEPAIREVRGLGFLVGLHSGGTHPARLREVLPLLDWVGLDIKADAGDYERITQVAGSGASAFDSLRAVLDSGVRHECRTTIHPALHSEGQLRALARRLARAGVRHYALQVFRATGCDDAALNRAPTSGYPGPALVEELAALFPSFTLRQGG
ncbi:anaerobic ribonucleoside-triphosphate reductase activating protein [Parapusillimonas granuli]|uniref:Anaerobic ribonucleoside-triphosphate reductase activating protein n=1 Tax=Parapusillimonas granuli TaxID=380911 RepID=A0A853G6T1_9BURK|nr:anaerobic ribonucleoside-triphosphate reductase activating protein [Parapusillimonas granuli]MBB5216025.1 anaerobic ribonucleoside-triphosphate reductase activating protein [Parapusillimonas granuli]MEB2401297.1 anaerobic ribonucleoside-triphosphate reductase activating protein [Alcaligenaceae bacterium]NYT50680.1 anaerobic ribonucleoside-triphosphate reductase activating protein [Parapusillimonas granuli]